MIVCSCNYVKASDVHKMCQENPEMSPGQIQEALKIGTRCGSCVQEDSPLIDISFKELITEI